MHLSRRTFLRTGLAAAGALVVGGAGILVFEGDLQRGARCLYHRLTDPPVPPAPTGGLDATTARVLRAAAVALVGDAGRQERYLEPFRWRARHLPGLLALYRRFAGFVDAEARGRHGSGFTGLAREPRRRLLAECFPGGRLRQAWTGWRRPERVLQRRHVVREILAVYLDTDAWRDLGYADWPGMPRGLDAYRRRPPGGPP